MGIPNGAPIRMPPPAERLGSGRPPLFWLSSLTQAMLRVAQLPRVTCPGVVGSCRRGALRLATWVRRSSQRSGGRGGVRGTDALFDAGPGVVKLPAALSPSRAGDFQQCPLLVPAARGGQDPRAAERRRDQGHAGARRARAAVRPAGGPADAGRGGGAAAAAVGAAAGGEARARRPVRDGRGASRLARGGREAARHVFHLGGPDPAGTGEAGAVRPSADGRGRGPAAAARLRRPADIAPNGLLRVVDYKTGKAPPRGLRGEDALPDEVLRASCCGRCAAWSRSGCSCCSSATARC